MALAGLLTQLPGLELGLSPVCSQDPRGHGTTLRGRRRAGHVSQCQEAEYPPMSSRARDTDRTSPLISSRLRARVTGIWGRNRGGGDESPLSCVSSGNFQPLWASLLLPVSRARQGSPFKKHLPVIAEPACHFPNLCLLPLRLLSLSQPPLSLLNGGVGGKDSCEWGLPPWGKE